MNRISLITTTYCNQSCEYCDIPLLESRREYKYNNRYLSWISDNFEEIEFTGGEVGTLRLDKIKTLFNVFQNNKIFICTNGLFLDRYFYYFYEKINGLLYHIVDFNNFVLIEDPKVQYDMIIHNNNMADVVHFFRSFDISKINLKLVHLRTPDKSLILSEGNINILKKLNLLKDYNPCNEDTYLSLIDKCCKSPIIKAIDLVSNEIMHCCTRYTNIKRWPLNESNLIQLKNNTLFEDVDSSSCYGCTLVYKFRKLIE